jgi:hypothetical protein
MAMAAGECSANSRTIDSRSRKAASARCRTSAMLNICATSCSRFTISSGQVRSVRVAKANAATIGPPPTESPTAKTLLLPSSWKVCLSRPDSVGNSSREEKAATFPARICFADQGKSWSALIRSGIHAFPGRR